MTITRSTVVALIGLSLAVIGGVGGLLLRIVWPAPILPTTFGVGPNALVVIARFAERLRDQIDLAHLSRDLDKTIRAAIAPRSVEIWLREDRR